MSAPPRTPEKPKSVGAWAKSHHAEIYIGAAGLALTALLYYETRKGKTTTTPSTTGTSTPASTISYYLPATSGAGETGSPSGSWSGAGYPGPGGTGPASTTTKTPGTTVARTAGKVLGASTGAALGFHTGGYSILSPTGKLEGGSVVGNTGGTFTTFQSWTATTAAEGQGTQVDIQVAPGAFQAETPQELATLEQGGKRTLTTWFKAA